MLCDVVVRRRWAHAPVIHAASHFYHEKRVAWVSIFMYTCDPVPIVMGLRLAARRSSAITFSCSTRYLTRLRPSFARYRVERSKIKFISTDARTCNILYLVYAKIVDSVKRARWLACHTPNILCYLPPSNSGKMASRFASVTSEQIIQIIFFFFFLSHCFSIY